MTCAELAAIAGISILLVFLLNTRKITSANKKSYSVLNIIRASVYEYLAYLISFSPSGVPELGWVAIADLAIFKNVSRETPKVLAFHVKS